jgi:hypothetical protein
LRVGGRNIDISTVGLLVLYGMHPETALSATERAKGFRENINDRDDGIIYCAHKRVSLLACETP